MSSINFDISKGDKNNVTTKVEGKVLANKSTYVIDLNKALPVLEDGKHFGKVVNFKLKNEDGINSNELISSAKVEDNKLKLELSDSIDKVRVTEIMQNIQLTLESTNYNDFDSTIELKIIKESIPVVIDGGNSKNDVAGNDSSSSVIVNPIIPTPSTENLNTNTSSNVPNIDTGISEDNSTSSNSNVNSVNNFISEKIRNNPVI